MTRPIRPHVVERLAILVGVGAVIDQAEAFALATYETQWDALAALPVGDPAGAPLVRTLSAQLNRRSATGG